MSEAAIFAALQPLRRGSCDLAAGRDWILFCTPLYLALSYGMEMARVEIGPTMLPRCGSLLEKSYSVHSNETARNYMLRCVNAHEDCTEKLYFLVGFCFSLEF